MCRIFSQQLCDVNSMYFLINDTLKMKGKTHIKHPSDYLFSFKYLYYIMLVAYFCVLTNMIIQQINFLNIFSFLFEQSKNFI